jgi:hypothetical protein
LLFDIGFGWKGIHLGLQSFVVLLGIEKGRKEKRKKGKIL